MSHTEIVKALVAYRVLEEQKAKLEEQQKALKQQVEAHMIANKLDNLEANDVVAQLIPRTKYSFDVKGILKAVPTAVSCLKLSNEDYLKLLKGNEDLIGDARRVVSNEKSLTIRAKKVATE